MLSAVFSAEVSIKRVLPASAVPGILPIDTFYSKIVHYKLIFAVYYWSEAYIGLKFADRQNNQVMKKVHLFILFCLLTTTVLSQKVHIGLFGGLSAYNGDLVDKIFPKKVNTPEYFLPCDDDQKQAIVEKVKEND